ncbi:MAG: nuclear transport factor 2 family protein [Cyclobacteriaceae bacterium]
MKISLCVMFVLTLLSFSNAQSKNDKKLVEKACWDYIDGFYKGDTTKIISSVKPSLNKLGYWKAEGEEVYKSDGYMTFEQARKYSKRVLEEKNFPKSDAPKKVEVLDVMNQIASAKVTLWWGTDYLLLSKEGDKWMIEQVLWEGPLQK